MRSKVTCVCRFCLFVPSHVQEYVCSTLSSLLSQLYYKPPEPLTEETSSLTHTEDIKELQHGEREIEREQLHHAAESKGSRDQKEASFEGASEFYVNEHKESTPSTAVVDFHNSPLLAVSPPSSSSTSSSESGNEVAGDLSVPLTAGHHSPVSNGGSPQCAVERVAPMQDDMEAVDGSGKTGCEMSGRVSNGKSDVTRGPGETDSHLCVLFLCVPLVYVYDFCVQHTVLMHI